jgi:hypothetical protein
MQDLEERWARRLLRRTGRMGLTLINVGLCEIMRWVGLHMRGRE